MDATVFHIDILESNQKKSFRCVLPKKLVRSEEQLHSLIKNNYLKENQMIQNVYPLDKIK